MPVGCLPPPWDARRASAAPGSPSLRPHCRCWRHAGGAQGGVPWGLTARPSGAQDGTGGHPTGTHTDRGARLRSLQSSPPPPPSPTDAGPGAMAARAPWPDGPGAAAAAAGALATRGHGAAAAAPGAAFAAPRGRHRHRRCAGGGCRHAGPGGSRGPLGALRGLERLRAGAPRGLPPAARPQLRRFARQRRSGKRMFRSLCPCWPGAAPACRGCLVARLPVPCVPCCPLSPLARCCLPASCLLSSCLSDCLSPAGCPQPCSPRPRGASARLASYGGSRYPARPLGGRRRTWGVQGPSFPPLVLPTCHETWTWPCEVARAQGLFLPGPGPRMTQVCSLGTRVTRVHVPESGAFFFGPAR